MAAHYLAAEGVATNAELSNFIFKTLTDVVTLPFAGIMGFYFTAHAIRSWQNGSKK
jgi:hypothetical protein